MHSKCHSAYNTQGGIFMVEDRNIWIRRIRFTNQVITLRYSASGLKIILFHERHPGASYDIHWDCSPSLA